MLLLQNHLIGAKFSVHDLMQNFIVEQSFELLVPPSVNLKVVKHKTYKKFNKVT